jgi:hypothetical protein
MPLDVVVVESGPAGLILARVFQQCSMARHGPPRRYENEPPPRLFSHQPGIFSEVAGR